MSQSVDESGIGEESDRRFWSNRVASSRCQERFGKFFDCQKIVALVVTYLRSSLIFQNLTLAKNFDNFVQNLCSRGQILG